MSRANLIDRNGPTGVFYAELKPILPNHFYLILKSHLEDRLLSARVGGFTVSPPAEIKAGVAQCEALRSPTNFVSPTRRPQFVHWFTTTYLASSLVQDRLRLLETRHRH